MNKGPLREGLWDPSPMVTSLGRPAGLLTGYRAIDVMAIPIGISI